MKCWILVIAASVAGCSSGTGSLGQACTYTSAGSDTLFGGTYSCNGGLLCNQAPQLNGQPVCQAPNSQGAGAACDDDALCESGLFCAPMAGGATCQPLLQEGAPCPSGGGCAPNLQCVKVVMSNGAYCLTAEDGGAEAGETDEAGTVDATAAGDAAQATEGGEAGDAAAIESQDSAQRGRGGDHHEIEDAARFDPATRTRPLGRQDAPIGG